MDLRNTGMLKSDGTFVSQGDLLSESLISSYLAKQSLNYVLISEESYNKKQNFANSEYIITIDPIDGTENFILGLKEWGVGMSVYRNLRHQQSMIYLPELDICLCTGDKLDRISYSRICGLSSYMSPNDFNFLDGQFKYRIMGCCMYNMYNVIRGSYAKFIHLKGCYSWDILPGINLALEHGLDVEIEGEKYTGEMLIPGIKYSFKVEYNGKG